MHHIFPTLIMICVTHLLIASQIKRKDTIKALVKVANKSQMIIRYILLMDISVVSKSRERTFSLHSARGHLSYPVRQGSWGSEHEKEVPLFFKPAMILRWCVNMAPKTWTPIMKNVLLFSFFFSLSECLKEEALARGWHIFIPLHVNLSFRQREIRPQIQCWGKQWWVPPF